MNAMDRNFDILFLSVHHKIDPRQNATYSTISQAVHSQYVLSCHILRGYSKCKIKVATGDNCNIS